MKFNAAFKKWFGDSKVVDKDRQPLVVYHGTNADEFNVFNNLFEGRHETSGVGIWFTDSKAVSETFATLPKTEYYYTDKDTGKEVVLPKNSYSAPHGEAVYFRDTTAGMRIIPAYLSMKDPLVFVSNGSRDAFEKMMDYRDKFVTYIGGSGRWTERYAATNTRQANKNFRDELRALDYDGILLVETVYDSLGKKPSDQYIVFESTQIKSAIGNDGTYDSDDADIRSNPDDTVKFIDYLFPGSKGLVYKSGGREKTLFWETSDVGDPHHGYIGRIKKIPKSDFIAALSYVDVHGTAEINMQIAAKGEEEFWRKAMKYMQYFMIDDDVELYLTFVNASSLEDRKGSREKTYTLTSREARARGLLPAENPSLESQAEAILRRLAK